MVVLFRFLFAIFKSRFRRRWHPRRLRHRHARLAERSRPEHAHEQRPVPEHDGHRPRRNPRAHAHAPAGAEAWLAADGRRDVLRYRKSLLPFERFTVRSHIVCWDEKWLYFEHILERRGEVAAQAYVRGLLRGKSGNVKPRSCWNWPGAVDAVAGNAGSGGGVEGDTGSESSGLVISGSVDQEAFGRFVAREGALHKLSPGPGACAAPGVREVQGMCGRGGGR